MPVYLGSNAANINIGSTTPTVYLGSTRVWPNGPLRLGTARSNSTGSGTLTVNYPSSSAAGDLIVVNVNAGRNITGAFTMSSSGASWTQIVLGNHASAAGWLFGVYYIVRGNETSFTVNTSPSTNFNTIIAECIAYKSGSFRSSAPIGNSSINSAATSGDPTSTAITISNPYTELLAFYQGWCSGSTNWNVTWSGTSGLVELTDQAHAVSNYITNLSSAVILKQNTGNSGTATVNTSGVTLAGRGVAMVAVQSP